MFEYMKEDFRNGGNMWEKISGKYIDVKKIIIKIMIKFMENEILFKKGRELGFSCESYYS